MVRTVRRKRMGQAGEEEAMKDWERRKKWRRNGN
jgi:hypothetical protein